MAGYIGANTSSVTNNQNAAERRKKFTFTTNTTVLSGLNFAPEKIHIFHNGIRLVRTTDYTEASDGKSVTLVNAAQAGDEVVAVTFAQDPASNAGYTDADVDAHLLTAGVTLDATNDRVGFGTSSPVKKIHIDESAAAGEGILLTNSNNVAGTYSDLKWQYSGADASYGSGLRFRQVDTTHGGQLEFYTDSSTGTYTKQMQITEDGHVTKPNQPMFRIRCASVTNVDATGDRTISGSDYQSNTLVQTGGTNFNVSTGRFTAPVSGYYYFAFSNRIDSFGGSYFYFSIMDGGGSVIARNLTSLQTTYHTLHAAAVHYMSANDYVFSRLSVSGDTNVRMDTDGFFSGFLIG